jgi:hypothetical protein
VSLISLQDKKSGNSIYTGCPSYRKQISLPKKDDLSLLDEKLLLE